MPKIPTKKTLLLSATAIAGLTATTYIYGSLKYKIERKIDDIKSEARREGWSDGWDRGWKGAEEHYSVYFTEDQYKRAFGKPRPW